MFPSSTLCRAQEARQRDRAAGTLLNNVRIVAERAATIWGQEALAAERREARYERTRAIARTTSLKKHPAREEEDRLLSENPDRGFEAS